MGASHLSIDLNAVAANWRALDAVSASAVETGAVIKANAYGLDVRKVAPKLAKAGVRTFFVAVAEEGATLRKTLGAGPDIIVFSGHMAGDTDLLRSAALIPLLNAPEQVTRHFTDPKPLPFGVQLDTGMNRLGMEPDDWRALSSELIDAGPRLVMSHLACADEPDHPMNAKQLRVFKDLTDGVAKRRSLAATGGTLLGQEFHFDLTRPGIGLYGGAPFTEATPVVQLDLPVIQTRTVQTFETVGYGNAWTAKIESRIATVAAGYADGLIRAMGPKATLFADTTPCPVVGRVSMDLITVDVTHLDETPDALSILGPRQGVDAIADAAGTIGYEILTSLGHRYRRSYEGAE
ncbi:MAG: alanine racemase [Pseudomonadota bacterium]